MSYLLSSSIVRLATFAFLPLGCLPLLAVPITGTVNIAGAVGLGATTIDFRLPIGLPAGQFTVTETGNTESFIPLGSTTGSILDLNVTSQPVGQDFFLPGFLTFAGAPNVRFDLTYIEPGVFPSASCGLAPAPGQTCTPAPFPNGTPNPFNLVNTSIDSSVASFNVRGRVVNTATGEGSVFSGTFSTQFADKSYQELLADVRAGMTIPTSYSASLRVSLAPVAPVPEPGAIMLLTSGLLALGVLRRQRCR